MSREETPREGFVVEASGGAVVVRIPAGTRLDGEDAAAVNDVFLRVVRRDEVGAVLTVIGAGVSLTDAAFDEVRRAVAAGYDLGVERWAVVATEPDVAASFTGHVDGIDARQFDDETAAREWLGER